MEKYFYVLSRGVKDLHDLFRRKEFVKRRKVYVLGQGIDDSLDFEARCLDQAQLRPIGLIAHELGIEGHIWPLAQFSAESRQRLGVGDDPHALRLTGFVSQLSRLERLNLPYDTKTYTNRAICLPP